MAGINDTKATQPPDTYQHNTVKTGELVDFTSGEDQIINSSGNRIGSNSMLFPDNKNLRITRTEKDEEEEEEVIGDMPRVEEIDMLTSSTSSSKHGNDRRPLLGDHDDDVEQPPNVSFRKGHHVHNGSIGSASDLGSHAGKSRCFISDENLRYHTAKALQWRVEQLLKCLIKKITPSSQWCALCPLYVRNKIETF